MRSKAPYGIDVSAVLPDQNELSLSLTLRSGSRYCCPICRCGFNQEWDSLRRWLSHAGIEMGVPMRIRLREICERGALIAEDSNDLSTCKPVEDAWNAEEYVIDESDPST